MEENTIFDKSIPASQSQPVSISNVSNVSVQNSVEGAPLPKPPLASKQMWQKTLPTDEGGFPFSKILKGLLGFIFLGVLIFLMLKFVLPKFSQTKVEQVTLTLWGAWEGENVINPILSDFEKNYPNIKVKYEKQDIKQYRDRVVTRIGNGTGPDVFLFHNTWLPEMVSFLTPLSSDVISKDDFQKNFYQVIVNDLTHNGAIYGMPTGIDTLSLFVNTDILQQAGATPPANWQDFSQIARALTVKSEDGKIKTAGAAIGTFDNITHAPDLISLLLVQNGANINNISDTKDNVGDTLDFYTSFAKGNAGVWDDTLEPSMLAFSKGNLAMYFGYSWDIFAIKQLNPKLPFKVFPVPHLTGRTMTIASYWANGVSAKSKHQKEALALLKFLSSKETMQRLFSEESKTRLFGEIYPRKDLTDSLKDNQLIYPFVSQANDAVSSFFASDTFDNGLNSQMNGYIGNAIRSVLGNTSTETAVTTLSQGVDQVIRQYGGQ